MGNGGRTGTTPALLLSAADQNLYTLRRPGPSVPVVEPRQAELALTVEPAEELESHKAADR